MQCCLRAQRPRASNKGIRPCPLRTDISPASLNRLMMICTEDDEICKAFAIWLWGTLFLKYSTIFLRALSQIGEPCQSLLLRDSASLKPYSDWISFTRADGVMLIYHRTSVILMANSHWIKNLSKTTRSGMSNYLRTAVNYLLSCTWYIDRFIKLIKLWLDSVCNRHLPKTNRSFVPPTSAVDLLFDLNCMHCHMQKAFKVWHRLVPPHKTPLNASSVEKKHPKKYFKYKMTVCLYTYLQLSIRTGFFRTF